MYNPIKYTLPGSREKTPVKAGGMKEMERWLSRRAQSIRSSEHSPTPTTGKNLEAHSKKTFKYAKTHNKNKRKMKTKHWQP